ncbi:hypothetical protein ACFV4M_12890 [Kitasatospora indigofera]|uniref:hypothetical protein n=1 Tax=Kitasatospora indigofera TaxID=67307 RepID=UPI00364C002E
MTALALREKVRAYNRRAELVRALEHLPPGPAPHRPRSPGAGQDGPAPGAAQAAHAPLPAAPGPPSAVPPLPSPAA